MAKKFTCLIPFYNESPRILKVLDKISQLKNQAEIICVDDGSTDAGQFKVRAKYPWIKLISLKTNQGKTAAVSAGLKKVKTPYVFLIDADLLEIDLKDFQAGMTLCRRQTKIDMLIFGRVNDPFHNPILAAHIILSGERIVKTKILKTVLRGSVKRFQLELALNQYCLNHRLTVVNLSSQARTPLKLQKHGLIGLKNDVRMTFELVNYIGVYNFLRQSFILAYKESRT